MCVHIPPWASRLVDSSSKTAKQISESRKGELFEATEGTPDMVVGSGATPRCHKGLTRIDASSRAASSRKWICDAEIEGRAPVHSPAMREIYEMEIGRPV